MAAREVVTPGLLPICIHCQKIRDDRDEWQLLEGYLGRHTDAEFGHGICPSCFVAHQAE